jgi:hypothetical protein
MESMPTPLNGNLSIDNACGTRYGRYKGALSLVGTEDKKIELIF